MLWRLWGTPELLEQVKVRVRTSRVQAARAVNTELVGLYWQIGRLILNRQESEGWGSRVIGRLAADLRAEFPGMRGLSQRSLVYMRTFAAAFEAPIAQHTAAQFAWETTPWCDRTRRPNPSQPPSAVHRADVRARGGCGGSHTPSR